MKNSIKLPNISKLNFLNNNNDNKTKHENFSSRVLKKSEKIYEIVAKTVSVGRMQIDWAGLLGLLGLLDYHK